MPTRIPQRELRNNNAEIIRRVEAGENFVVTRNGVDVADVIPHTSLEGPPRFPMSQSLSASETVHEMVVDRESWLRDIRGADRFIDDDPARSRA